jgi:hypothetical protein
MVNKGYMTRHAVITSEKAPMHDRFQPNWKAGCCPDSLRRGQALGGLEAKVINFGGGCNPILVALNEALMPQRPQWLAKT